MTDTGAPVPVGAGHSLNHGARLAAAAVVMSERIDARIALAEAVGLIAQNQVYIMGGLAQLLFLAGAQEVAR